eukprot:3299445-Pleurochrysis_carterae.AAC.3
MLCMHSGKERRAMVGSSESDTCKGRGAAMPPARAFKRAAGRAARMPMGRTSVLPGASRDSTLCLDDTNERAAGRGGGSCTQSSLTRFVLCGVAYLGSGSRFRVVLADVLRGEALEKACQALRLVGAQSGPRARDGRQLLRPQHPNLRARREQTATQEPRTTARARESHFSETDGFLQMVDKVASGHLLEKRR